MNTLQWVISIKLPKFFKLLLPLVGNVDIVLLDFVVDSHVIGEHHCFHVTAFVRIHILPLLNNLAIKTMINMTKNNKPGNTGIIKVRKEN
jgi:hypothetical protein